MYENTIIESCLRELLNRYDNNYYVLAVLCNADVRNVRKWLRGVSQPGSKHAKTIIKLYENM